MSSIAALIAPQHHKPGPEKQRGLSATLTDMQQLSAENRALGAEEDSAPQAKATLQAALAKAYACFAEANAHFDEANASINELEAALKAAFDRIETLEAELARERCAVERVKAERPPRAGPARRS
jgi:chromosome segregation ATPase